VTIATAVKAGEPRRERRRMFKGKGKREKGKGKKANGRKPPHGGRYRDVCTPGSRQKS
jgi:hypothetical protein